jgi:glycosyltransferase involved in cell wall biosynthesis
MFVKNSATKVVHVLSSLHVGGAERFVLDLSKVQRAQGDSVSVFACSTEKEALFEEASAEPSDCLLSSGSRWRDYKAVLACFRLNTSKNKVFHIHTPHGVKFFILLLPFLSLYGIKVIYTRHGIAPYASKEWKFIHLWSRLFISWVTFVSDAGQDTFFKWHGWSKKILVTISNGVFVPEEVMRQTSDKIRLGSVGRMVGLKGQAHLIAAVSQLDVAMRENIEIHFFGDGPEQSALKVLAEQKLNAEQAVFHGMELNRDKVYGEIDILVVCSEQEGLSLALMEAMARRIPAIATKVGDSPKLVLNDETGYLYEYGDIATLTELIAKFCADAVQPKSALRQRLGESARTHMIEHFSLERANEQYQACYKS